MDEIVNISKFPEGLEILAEKLDLPIPKEDMEARKALVLNIVSTFINY